MKFNKFELAFAATACVGWAAMNQTASGALSGIVLGVLVLATIVTTRLAQKIPLFNKGGAAIPLLLIPIFATVIAGGVLLAISALFNPADAALNNQKLLAQNAEVAPQEAPSKEDVMAIWGMLNTEIDKRDLSNTGARIKWIHALNECTLAHSKVSPDITPEIMETLGKCADEKVRALQADTQEPVVPQATPKADPQ